MSPRNRRSYLRSSYWSAEEAREALADQQASGLSVIAFAERAGLQAQRLFVWRRRLAAESVGPSAVPPFIEIRSSPPPTQPIELVLRNGVVLRVPPHVEPETVARWVAALEQSSRC